MHSFAIQNGFKRTITWNEYQSKVSTERQNLYLDHLIDPRLTVLSYEDGAHRTLHTEYFLPKVEIKDFNVMIDGQNFFDHPFKNDMRTYDNIWKITTGQGDDYTTDCLLDYI